MNFVIVYVSLMNNKDEITKKKVSFLTQLLAISVELDELSSKI